MEKSLAFWACRGQGFILLKTKGWPLDLALAELAANSR